MSNPNPNFDPENVLPEDVITELEEAVAEEMALEPNDTDDDSDKDAPNYGNNYPPDMDYSLIN